jgi:hypothetical protein
MTTRFIQAALVALMVGITACPTAQAQNNRNGNGNGNGNGNRTRGNRDPAQYQERRMARYRDQLEIKSDDEWKAIQPLVEKVLQAQREVRAMEYGGMMRGGPPGGGQNDAGSGGFGGGRGFRGGTGTNIEANPDVVALQKAISSNAGVSEVKARLARYRDTYKQKQTNLAKAQDDLRQVLTAHQEGAAVLAGLLR